MRAVLAFVLVTQPAAASLADLRADGDFTITLAGPELKSFPSGRVCVYWEWAAGQLRDGDWMVRVGGAHSGNRLAITTPRGTLDLAHGDVRLYLPASASQSYTAKTQAESTAEPVRSLLKEMDPLTVEEYLLHAGRRYHARIETETILLPPRGAQPPERRTKLLLAISDQPFKDSRPQRRLTPSFVGFR
jgi:hypothetical protein